MISDVSWENEFKNALLSVEELLASGDISVAGKSKIRLALEYGFLSWDEYSAWCVANYNCTLLKKLNKKQINQLKDMYHEQRPLLNHIQNLSDDLIAIESWDGHPLVLGLEYQEDIIKEQKSVFVLCHPDILSELVQSEESIYNNDETYSQISSDSAEMPAGLFEINDNQAGLFIKELAKNNVIATSTELEEEKSEIASFTGTSHHNIWHNIDKQHQDFSIQARKQFDAYIVLKVNSQQKTELYKMDEDLEKEELHSKLFEYDLNQDNPFKNVYENQITETFNINQLGLSILDFKYACISALKLGPKVIGFLVGFKTTHLSQDDISTLESISEKAV